MRLALTLPVAFAVVYALAAPQTNSARLPSRTDPEGDVVVSQVAPDQTPSNSQPTRNAHFYNPRTFGRFEDAAGLSVTINSGLGQARENTQILGTDARGLTKYQDRDHVALYVSASSFPPLVTTGSQSRYSSAGITAPEINASAVRPGMIIETNHPTKLVGIVTSVSDSTATVGAWYEFGSGLPRTPANGVSATINPNTRIWGANINVVVAKDGQASNGTGIELGLSAQKPGSGANTWGYDAITLAGEKPLAHFISRGQRTVSFLSSNSGGDFGFLSDSQSVGFESRDAKAYSHSAVVKGVRKWSVNASGANSRRFEAFRAVSVSGPVGEDDVFISVAAPGVSLQLPSAAGMVGRIYTFRSRAGFRLAAASDQSIDGSRTKVVPANVTVRVIGDGQGWMTY